ncbi:MAG: CCA tRNA nucleotidyltransferase [Candidatus Latescibacteria bacterium]|nr:CCA tRNA nucleotidyltransferase [Candidatus Latescibacterota bacterium]
MHLKKKQAFEIISVLREAGFTAYIVGGAVRDMVMGLVPMDYDIATDASSSDLEYLFGKVYPVGRQFGVNMVVIGQNTFEIAQFRVEGIYFDGRRPSAIEPGNPIEDARRRDFTINALFYDPAENSIIDHVNGIADIKNKVVRTVGDPDIRFREDRLRMLRAIRFATRFSFKLDIETELAIKRHAGAVLYVSAERIGDELVKIFSGPHPAYALVLLDRTGLLDVVLPEVSALKGVEQPPEFHPEGDVYEHTCRMLELYDGNSVTLAFGILLHDIAKPVTMTKTDRIRFSRHADVGAIIAGQILRRLRMKNVIISKVQELVRTHMHFINVRKMRRAKLLRFVLQDEFDEMLELYRIDCLSSHGKLDDYEFLLQTVDMEKQRNRKHQPPLLDGRDLIELGYEPGPQFGKILSDVEDMQLEGALLTKEEAKNFVVRTYYFQADRHNQKRKNNPQDPPVHRDVKPNT